MYEGTLCDVHGITVGNAQDFDAGTGVTAILCPEGATAGIDVRGAAPGTRETDLLRCGAAIRKANAVLLCGGSAFGLAAADGAMRFLEANGYGVDVGVTRVPIVPAAVVFDLAYRRADVRPDAAMGFAACENAGSSFHQGTHGAGCGATIGKLIPGATPCKGGLGSASIRLPSGITVAAIAVVNAVGDIYDPCNGALLYCGTLSGQPVCAESMLLTGGPTSALPGQNTTIGVVATDAKLTKEQANRLATIAHDGLARTVRPVHTDLDGDSIFTLATGKWGSKETPEVSTEMFPLCTAAVEVFARAIVNGVEAAQ